MYTLTNWFSASKCSHLETCLWIICSINNFMVHQETVWPGKAYFCMRKKSQFSSIWTFSGQSIVLTCVLKRACGAKQQTLQSKFGVAILKLLIMYNGQCFYPKYSSDPESLWQIKVDYISLQKLRNCLTPRVWLLNRIREIGIRATRL